MICLNIVKHLNHMVKKTHSPDVRLGSFGVIPIQIYDVISFNTRNAAVIRAVSWSSNSFSHSLNPEMILVPSFKAHLGPQLTSWDLRACPLTLTHLRYFMVGVGAVSHISPEQVRSYHQTKEPRQVRLLDDIMRNETTSSGVVLFQVCWTKWGESMKRDHLPRHTHFGVSINVNEPKNSAPIFNSSPL